MSFIYGPVDLVEKIRLAPAHYGRFRGWVSMAELFEASASTRLESTKILLPSTRPSSTHWSTMRSRKLLNPSAPQRFRALERILLCRMITTKDAPPSPWKEGF